MRKIITSLLSICLFAAFACAYTPASKHLGESPEWYKSDEAKKIADFVLLWQAKDGGWPKNQDTTTQPSRKPDDIHSTFDNSAGFYELSYLLKMYEHNKDEKYSAAISRYIDLIISAQYANGGWPQSYPPSADKYNRYITFNDGTMQRLMFILLDVFKSERYPFLDADHKARAKAAFDKGIDCILKCQVKVDGKLTVWCAQHDETDFSPKPARAFEPVSLSGQESLSVMNVLMQVEDPSPEVIVAVDAAAAWFDAVRIKGIRIEDRPMATTPDGKKTPKGYERYVIEDKTAPDLWARFYELGTNKPIFMGRDSVVKYSLAEIDIERRTGYKWYGAWGAENRLSKEYPAWRAKVTGKIRLKS